MFFGMDVGRLQALLARPRPPHCAKPQHACPCARGSAPKRARARSRDARGRGQAARSQLFHCSFTKLAPDSSGRAGLAELLQCGWVVEATTGRLASMPAKPSELLPKRILLAEDDESMRSFLERALTKAGYEVIAFANGKDAHERLR